MMNVHFGFHFEFSFWVELSQNALSIIVLKCAHLYSTFLPKQCQKKCRRHLSNNFKSLILNRRPVVLLG